MLKKEFTKKYDGVIRNIAIKQEALIIGRLLDYQTANMRE